MLSYEDAMKVRGKEEALSCRRWLEAAETMMPSSFAVDAAVKMRKLQQPPMTSLELAWVYGYESSRGRNNVRYTSRGGVVYPVGRFVIVLDMDANRQTIFSGHADLINALAIHPVHCPSASYSYYSIYFMHSFAGGRACG